MKINKSGNNTFQLSKLFIKFNFLLKKKIFLILLYFFLIIISITSIFEFQKIFYTYQKGKTVITNATKIGINYLSSYSTEVPSIKIDINHKNFQKLEYIKTLSFENYIGDDNTDPISKLRKEWVNAEMNFENQIYPIKIRIKGQSLDHWGKDPSYKIKVRDGKTIMGMKRFALQHPKTRGFMNEWYFHEFLKFNDLIHLRYKFINLSINGDNRPIYALEENFDKRLIENNRRKNGLIFRIINQGDRVIKFQQPESEIKDYLKFGTDDLINKIDLFFDNKIEIDKVFDIESLAKLYAIVDLWGNRHAVQLKNIRFYYNPSTSLIEPVAYDQQVAYHTQILGLLGSNKKIGDNVSEQSHFFDVILKNKSFYKEYIRQLEIISSKILLDSFFNRISNDERLMLNILYKSYPYFEYKSIYPSLEWPYQDRDHTRHLNSIWLPKEKNALYENQKYIIKTLKLNDKSVTGHLINFDDNEKKIVLRLTNHESFVLEINSINFKDGSVIKLKDNNLINPKNLFKSLDYLDIEINIPKDLGNIKKIINETNISVSILGSNQIIKVPVSKKINIGYYDKLSNYSDIDNFEGINIDRDNKNIIFDKGTININKNLVIKPGYNVIANAGTKINLKNNANIVSYSPIYFIGNTEQPVKVSANYKSTIIIINANKKSILKHVVLNNLSELNYDGLSISGGINFYQSDIELNSCNINNFNAEDSINIVRSKFTIENCVFKSSKSDALDIDFSDGNIINTNFYNSGNDSIDVSGSKVNLLNILINGSRDKGISIGENSIMNINHAKIINSKIAIAVKDKSILFIDKNYKKLKSNIVNEGLVIDNCEYGIAIYQKKPEFGSAEVYIGNRKEIYKNILFKNTNDHFIIEKGSFLEVGSQRIENYENNVYKKIYK